MGKYADLIDSLLVDGKQRPGVQEALVKAEGRAFRPLVKALLNHPDGVIREICAEILGEHGSTKALPYLVEALTDPEISVREDALRAIEKILLIQPSGLKELLDVYDDEPDIVQTVVKRFLHLNREYIANLWSK